MPETIQKFTQWNLSLYTTLRYLIIRQFVTIGHDYVRISAVRKWIQEETGI